jgi:hypothetical protein
MKQLMKLGILIGVNILLLAAQPAFSAHWTDKDGEKYRANETSLDLFGSGSVGQETLNRISDERLRHDLRLGAGAGLNHFFTRHFGLGVEAYSENTGHSFVDDASISLIGRLPLGNSGFAPYVYGGAGHQFDPIELNHLHAGGGLEYRFTPKVGLFVDARYVFTDETKDYGLGRVGLRFTF